jgi:virulence-associated protein VapD
MYLAKFHLQKLLILNEQNFNNPQGTMYINDLTIQLLNDLCQFFNESISCQS